jgi:uncharacterized membrane protein
VPAVFSSKEERMLEQALTWLGFGLCHQLPERSFAGGGIQVPVCARDEGIYVGFVVAILVVSLLQRGRRPSGASPWWVILILLGFIGAMAIDGVTSYAGLRETTNAIRLVTGLMAGFAIGAFTLPLVNGQLWRHPGAERVLGRPRDAVLFFAALPATFGLILFALPLLGPLYPVLVAAAILTTFTTVCLVMVCLLPPFERKAERLRDAWLAIAVALLMAVVILGAASLLRLQLLRMAGLSQ